jgi:GT2 family glycosyltransferase
VTTITGAPDPFRPDAATVADCIVNSVLLCADISAQIAAPDYWEMSAQEHLKVLHLMQEFASDARLAADLSAARASPADARAIKALHDTCRDRAARCLTGDCPEGDWNKVIDAAWAADQGSRLWIHSGEEYDPGAGPVGTGDIPAPSARLAGTSAPVAVVIPFRDRSAGHDRLRNLLACLHALGDQSLDRAMYRVITVEIDDRPRWADMLRDRSDSYVFVRCPGHFNKAWGINAGVVQAAGGSDILCVLDADMLVDRDFLARNVRRFASRGAQAHWPFVDPLCLDAAATDAAIAHRCLKGGPDVPLRLARGVRLRRPPGHCVWLRAPLFHRIGGMDERFEGWGGEDLDFVFRLDIVGAVDRYPDTLLHMHHPRPEVKRADGTRFYAGRRLLDWHPITPIGQLTGPATSAGTDVAGIIEAGR